MRKILATLIFCAVFSKVMLDTIFYHDCGSEYDLDDVDIEGCNKTTCILQKGQSANVHIKLYGRNPESEHLKQTVNLIFNGLYVPVPVTPDDLCATAVDCPVRHSANASFSAIMDFALLPNVQSAVIIDWRIYNEAYEMIMCFRANAKYENPKTRNHHHH